MEGGYIEDVLYILTYCASTKQKPWGINNTNDFMQYEIFDFQEPNS